MNAKKSTQTRGKANRKPRQRKPKPAAAAAASMSTNTIRPSRPVKEMSHRGASHSSLHDALCSQTDPFCIHAKGAKMFDRSMTPSSTFQVLAFGTVSTVGVTGQGALQVTAADIFAAGGYGPRTALTYTGVTNAVATWNGASVPSGNAFLASNAAKMRIVSWGVRVFSSVAPDLASGVVTVMTTTGYTATPNLDATDATEIHRYPLAGHQSTWVAKPIDDLYANYVIIGGGGNMLGYWPVINIGVSGGPTSGATAVLVYEVVWNVEFVSVLGTTANLQTPAAPHIPAVESMVGQISTQTSFSTPGPTSTLSAIISRQANNAIEKLAEAGMKRGTQMLLSLMG